MKPVIVSTFYSQLGCWLDAKVKNYQKKYKQTNKPIYIHEFNYRMSSNDAFLLSVPVWNSD